MSDTNEVRAIDALLQPPVNPDVPANVIHLAPNIASFTDELLGQPSQAASEPAAACATATTVALSSETAPASQPISASAVDPALPSRERLTRQSLQELAPYLLTDEHDPLGRRTIWLLENDQFNTQAIRINLNFRREAGDCSSGTHFVKGVSGANEGCWWRAVWLSALLQHAYSSREENSLEENIVGDLGEHFRPEAQVVTEMITPFENMVTSQSCYKTLAARMSMTNT